MRVLFGMGAVGAGLTALCCAGVGTALLVAGLTALGLGALTRNLDAVLLASLAVFLALAAIGWAGQRKHRVLPGHDEAPIGESLR